MCRILLLGHGPFPPAEPQRLSTLAFRTWRLAHVLQQAGHELCVLAVTPPETDPWHSLQRLSMDNGHYYALDPRLHLQDPELLAGFANQFMPDALLATGVDACAALARLNLPIPTWFDLGGFACGEAQQRDAQADTEDQVPRQLESLQKVFQCGDVFSSVSEAHSYAILGQLGLSGRLIGRAAQYSFVHELPPTQPFDAAVIDRDEARAGLSVCDKVLLVWSAMGGSFTDVDTLTAGVIEALETNQELVFAALGNDATPAEATVSQQVQEILSASTIADRCRFTERTTGETLAYYLSAADIGLSVDQPTYEALLGARDWLVSLLRYQVPVITTLTSELSRAVDHHGCGYSFYCQDPAELAKTVLQALTRLDALQRLGSGGRELFERSYSFAAPARSLLQWANAPRFAPDREPVVSVAKPNHEVSA